MYVKGTIYLLKQIFCFANFSNFIYNFFVVCGFCFLIFSSCLCSVSLELKAVRTPQLSKYFSFFVPLSKNEGKKNYSRLLFSSTSNCAASAPPKFGNLSKLSACIFYNAGSRINKKFWLFTPTFSAKKKCSRKEISFYSDNESFPISCKQNSDDYNFVFLCRNIEQKFQFLFCRTLSFVLFSSISSPFSKNSLTLTSGALKKREKLNSFKNISEKVFTFFPNAQLTLRRASSHLFNSEYNNNSLRTATTIPFSVFTSVDNSMLFNNYSTAHMHIKININEKNFSFLIDPFLSKSYVKLYHFYQDDYFKQKENQKEVEFKNIKILDKNLSLKFLIMSDYDKANLSEDISGILGVNFLRCFSAVSVNFKKNLLTFYSESLKEDVYQRAEIFPFHFITNNLIGLKVRISRADRNAFDILSSKEEQIECSGLISLGFYSNSANVLALQDHEQKNLYTDKHNSSAFLLEDIFSKVKNLKDEKINKIEFKNNKEQYLTIEKEKNVKVFEIDEHRNERLFRPKINATCLGVIISNDLLNSRDEVFFDFSKNKLILRNTNNEYLLEKRTSCDDKEKLDELVLMETEKMKKELMAGKRKFQEIKEELSKKKINVSEIKSIDEMINIFCVLKVKGEKALDESLFMSKEESKKKVQAEIKNTSEKDMSELSTKYQQKLEELMNYYKSLSKNSKLTYIQNLVSILDRNNIKKNFQKTSEVLKEYARFTIYGTPNTKNLKSINEGTMNLDNYNNEFKLLTNKHKELSLADKSLFIEEVKNELYDREIDYVDCKSTEELLKRLAYARVFSSNKPKSHQAEIVENKDLSDENDEGSLFSSQLGKTFSKGNKGFFSDSFGASFSSPFEKIFEEFFSGFPFSGDTDTKRTKRVIKSNNNGMSVYIVQRGGGNQLFADNLSDEEDGEAAQKEAFNEVVHERVKEEKGDSKARKNKKQENNVVKQEQQEETDKDFIEMINKVKRAGNSDFLNFLLKALKDTGIRAVLKEALIQGYETTRKRYSDKKDSKAIYVLEKFREAHII